MEIDSEQNNFLPKNNHDNNNGIISKRRWMDAIPNDQEKEEYERAAFEYQMAQEDQGEDEMFEESDENDINEQLDTNSGSGNENNCGPIDWTLFLNEQERLKKEAFKNRKKVHVKRK